MTPLTTDRKRGEQLSTVVADFNETLVVQRTLSHWCLDAMTSGPLPSRLLCATRCALLGVASRVVDPFDGVLAAKIGFRVFAGVSVAALDRWARTRLSPNPRARDALRALAAELGPLELIVVSRGTPSCAIRSFLDSAPAHALLEGIELTTPTRVMAPELEVRAGILTGRLTAQPLEKSARATLLPGEFVFLGDRRDRRWASRASQSRVRFVQI